jgi:hypothetical protein
MKEKRLNLSYDYRSLHESSCECLKKSIINALGEIFLLTDLEAFSIERKNSIKVNDEEISGVCIKKGFLHLIILSGEKTRYVRIYDKQKDETFKKFDSDINNWITFIEKIQEEFNNGLIL